MKRFINQYNELFTGMLSCFDRILFKGYPPLWGNGMEAFLANQGLRIKGFSKFVQKQSGRIAGHAERMAKNSGRPSRPCAICDIWPARNVAGNAPTAASAVAKRTRSADCLNAYMCMAYWQRFPAAVAGDLPGAAPFWSACS